MNETELSRALEAILFAAGDSVEEERLCTVLGVGLIELRSAAERLERELREAKRGIEMIRLESRYQLVTAAEWSDYVVKAMEKRRTARLTPAALEVLSIVAYYQPVTRSYIEKVRGADSSYTVSYLSERGLIAPCGKLEAPGRPTLFATTEEFLRVMGISDLSELPPLPDIAEDEGRAMLRMTIEEKQESGEAAAE